MPIYEFACTRCHHAFERLIRSAGSEADAADLESDLACPECGTKDVERRWSVFSARGASAAKPAGAPGGGHSCGRCGDPSGPCGR